MEKRKRETTTEQEDEWKRQRKQDPEQGSETGQQEEQEWEERQQDQEEDYDDDDDDDDDDDEEEEEEEYSEEEGSKNYQSKKKKKSSRFIELEAEVDEEDDEEEVEEGDDIERELIDDDDAEEVEDTMASVQQRKALLDRMRSENPEELRRFVRERYGEVDDEEEEQEEEEETQGLQREYVKDKGIEQQGLLPTVQDPKLFLVKCRVGREKEAVICLLQKYYEYSKKKTPLDFFSAVAPEHLRGYVYVEAYTADSVKKAIDGLRILFSNTLKLIPVEEMVDVLSIVPETNQIERGGWVRISRGTYAGDLAQVYDFREGETNVTVRLIPRIDLQEIRNEDDAEKKKVSTNKRPPQRLFKREEMEQLVGSEVFPRRDRYTGEVFDVFRNENYRDGLLYKRVSIRNLMTGDEVAPTFEELEMFHKAQRLASNTKRDGNEEEEDEEHQQELEDTMEKTLELSLDTLSSDIEKNMNFCVGDSVIVTSGDLKNLSGRIESMESNNMVAVRPDDPELKGELIQFSKEELKKYFREGSHVKAINGRHTGETGMVVGIAGDIITVFSDITNEEVRFHASQLTETTEESSSKSAIGSFELLDLVTLHSDPRTRGVIVRIQRDHATILDTNGANRTVSVKDIRNKLDGKRAQALDINQKPLQVGDVVKVVQGVHKNREGTIRHVASPFVFVNVKDEPQNCGIIVVRAHNCQGPHSTHTNFNMLGQNNFKNNFKATTLSSMFSLGANGTKGNSTFTGLSGNIGKGHKEDDKLVRQDVLIKSGPWKGYIGKVVSATTASVRVELDSVCKTVTVDRSRVVPKDTAHVGGEKQKPYLPGAYTPSYEMGSQTPAYAGMGSMATPLHHVGYTPVYAPFTPTMDSARQDAPRTPIHNAWRPTTPGTADYSTGNRWSDLGLSMYSPFASSQEAVKSKATHSEDQSLTDSPLDDNKETTNSLSIAKAWVDCLVEHKANPTIRGYIGGHSPDGMYLQVEQESGSSGSYALSDMQLVMPEKNDTIKVVDGEYAGMKGNLLNAEGDEGIVQFEDGEIKILPVSGLGKVRG